MFTERTNYWPKIYFGSSEYSKSTKLIKFLQINTSLANLPILYPLKNRQKTKEFPVFSGSIIKSEYWQKWVTYMLFYKKYSETFHKILRKILYLQIHAVGRNFNSPSPFFLENNMEFFITTFLLTPIGPWCLLKYHTYLNKPAALTCRFL